MSKHNNSKKKGKLAKAYTVKITPEAGEDTTKFTVSDGTVRHAMVSSVLGAVLFVGAFALAAYGLFDESGDKEALRELRSVGRMQQEQMSQVMRRVNNLQTEMDKLEQQENELRQLIVAAGSPLPAPEKQPLGQGGAVGQSLLKDLDLSLDNLEQRLNTRRKSVGQLEDILRERRERIAQEQSELAAMPSGLPSDGEFSSSFGLRWGGSDFHPGVDIADDYGTPVFATASGTVTFAGWNSGGYGNLVEIDHENGIQTLYAHNEEVLVHEGQQVKKGEMIALMGSTGFSTGPHVHYEVIVNGEQVNPSRYY